MLDAAFIEGLTRRLSANAPVRRRLASSGRIYIDRQLPFLTVYRRRSGRSDRSSPRLVTGQASYLIGTDDPEEHRGLQRLVTAVAGSLSALFGAFLVVEIWPAQNPADDGSPTFGLRVPSDPHLRPFVDFFAAELAQVVVGGVRSRVRIVRTKRRRPPGTKPLLSAGRAAKAGVTVVGLEVGPIYRDSHSDTEYPEILRELRRGLGRAMQRAFHRFSCSHTLSCPVDYTMLGRRAILEVVWEADRKLSEVFDGFDFLLQVTPLNAGEAWEEFRRSDFEQSPYFRYRPLPIDAALLKRRLYAAPIERIEDPTLSDLFRQKQDELDRQISLLLDIGTPSFVHGAAQIFGEVDDALLRLARQVLSRTENSPGPDDTAGGVDANTFAERARAEIAEYKAQWSGVDAEVRVRSDITRGLMVSGGSLLIGAGTRIPAIRVEALLAHEVGTHILTYYNGKAQPFRQLYSGLAGYDALQEGIAVLAEYLVGGLSATRLRLLAARVVGVRDMLAGAEFVETFRKLTGKYGFPPRSAFTIAMRIYRGGGLTKDAVYLQGLVELLDYLRGGAEIEPLLIGKIATDHLPLVRELLLRGVLKPPPLRPRYLSRPAARERGAAVLRGMSVLDLVRATSTEP